MLFFPEIQIKHIYIYISYVSKKLISSLIKFMAATKLEISETQMVTIYTTCTYKQLVCIIPPQPADLIIRINSDDSADNITDVPL